MNRTVHGLHGTERWIGSGWLRFVHRTALISLVAAGLPGLPGCRKKSGPPPATVTESVTLFDQTVQVTLPYESAEFLDFAAKTYRTLATRNKDLLDVLDPESELSELNRIAPTRAFPVSEHTHRILYVAAELSERTMGMYDPTLAPWIYLWGFDGGLAPLEPVSDRAIELAGRGVGYQNMDVRTHLVAYRSPQTRVGLGDLAISYGLDTTIMQLREKGIRDILIDAGHIARSQGILNNETTWSRDLTNPFTLERNLGSYRLDQGFGAATVTMNDQYVTIDGERYHRIIDPRTGKPSRGTAAVTVLAPSATDAVALAQALFVVGVEDARELLARFPRCHAFMIPDREPMELWMTLGFQERAALAPDMSNRVFLF